MLLTTKQLFKLIDLDLGVSDQMAQQAGLERSMIWNRKRLSRGVAGMPQPNMASTLTWRIVSANRVSVASGCLSHRFSHTLSGRMSMEEILKQWPELEREDIYQALGFAVAFTEASVVSLERN